MVLIKTMKKGAAKPSICKWCGETKERKAVLSEEEAARPLLRAPLCPTKSKMHWTHGQHHLFLEAIDCLGIENARPKKILAYMSLPGISDKHIISHLQKHRLFMQKVAAKANFDNNPRRTNASSLQVILPNTGGLSIPNPMFANSTANALASLHFAPAPTTQPSVARIERRNAHEQDVMKNAPTVVNSPDQQNYGNGYLHDIIFYRPANKRQEGIPDQGVISSSSGTNMNGPSNELQKIVITDSVYRLEDFDFCFEQDPGQDIQLNGHRQGNNEKHRPEPTPPINDLFPDPYPNNYHEDAAEKLLHDGCL